MSRYQRNNKIVTSVILLIIVLSLVCLWLITWLKTGEEASVGIFSLAVTLLGTIFIAVELKNGQNVTCSDMLIDLNNYFHDSDRLMKVYEVLENQLGGIECPAKAWEDVKGVEIAQYCTFFENLYLLYRNEVASIDDLDDLFGYRFFVFVNNPYIQEKYILPTSSSYIQIFKLYEAWIGYRKKVGAHDWQKRLPYAKYAFSETYLKNKLYMNDFLTGKCEADAALEIKGKKFLMRQLTFEDTSAILNLQDECVAALPSSDLFFPLSREELLESLHLDTVMGVEAADGSLAAVSVLVSNRNSLRNLARDVKLKPTDAFTFDAVMVAPCWRGYGLQKVLVERAIAKSVAKGVAVILATVSPDNSHSLSNFLEMGFAKICSAEKYNGLKREILEYRVKSK